MADLTPEMTVAVAARIIQPVIIARLDIKDDPVTVWDGPGLFAPTSTGDPAMDGQIFSSAAGIVDLSNIVTKQGISDPVTAAMFGVDINDPLLRQVVRDKRQWRRREAWIWLGMMDITDPSRPVINHPTRLKYGVMAKISTNRDRENGVIAVTIDEDTGQSRGHVHRYADQRDYFADDTAGDFMHKLANSPKGINGREAWTNPLYGGWSGAPGFGNFRGFGGF